MFIGLFGGAFNPIHNGHLHIASYVHQSLDLDRIIFIPTGDPPHKPATSLAPSHHRLAMVRKALEPFPQFFASDCEVASPAISYSVDTVTRFTRQFDRETALGFIVGLDAFLEFSSWRNVDHLLTLCHIIVCSRPGRAFTQLQSLPFFPAPSSAALQALDERETTRIEVPLSSGKTVYLLAPPPCNIASSTIRKFLAQGRSTGHWLPSNVESYIIEYRLYQWPV